MLCFEGVVEFGDEGVVGALFKNNPFVFHNVLFHVLDYELLVDGFKGHQFTIGTAEVDP